MHKIIASLLFVLFAPSASPNSCPAKYRFVDFGLEDRQGILRKGGTIFRAFNAENTRLLKRDSVICHIVEENAIDGRALKMPVVSSIEIDLAVASIDFTYLQLRVSKNITPDANANANAALHHQTLSRVDTIKTQGDTYLRARPTPLDLRFRRSSKSFRAS